MKQILAVLMLLFVGIVKAADAPSPDFPWSSKVDDKIKEILQTKADSLKMQFTRSPDGRLGKKANAALEELADLLAAEHLGMADIPKEGTSIEAKIATWALDRKNRKQAYEDIAFYYCNRPEVEKWGIFLAKFQTDPARKKRALDGNLDGLYGRYGPEPEVILAEDLREEFRLPLEASYFLPPSGERFAGPLEPIWRSRLLRGLLALGSEKSLVVFISDIKVSIEAFKQGVIPDLDNPGHAGFSEPSTFFIVENSLYSIVGLVESPSLSAFSALSQLNQIGDFNQSLENGFESAFFVEVPGELDKKRLVYNSWQKLAATQFTSDADIKFARYIKQLAPPSHKDKIFE